MPMYAGSECWVRNTFVCVEGPVASSRRCQSTPPLFAGSPEGQSRDRARGAALGRCEGPGPAQEAADSTGPTTLVIGRLKKTSAKSLLRIVCGDRGDELCDYAFVPQDRLADGSLRNFRFGFVNFKNPADAAVALANGLGRKRYTVRVADVQGVHENIKEFWEKAEQRGMTGDFTSECRPIVQESNGWTAIPVPKHLEALVNGGEGQSK
eukprot:CAMPEP_0204393816 /NCGR_PEP_ID=MMETSP0469-20131031/62522_1 /ASSEMBLY_ACC=CAM_ASM_000384 /TAXON_ID=2969 /ORGANISM="Oxyrrhis marina" /LENGTH=208 /DNA_ID=CAMNT_0051387915 /DNA_START=42 /DNA_END=668 /DNA_ORIENTATION=+